MAKTPTEIVGWTHWEDDRFPDCSPIETENYEIAFGLTAEALRKHGYRFDGHAHQTHPCGVPVFDNGTKLAVSFRHWGWIMQLAYLDEIDGSDGMGYCDWAWDPPKSADIRMPPYSEQL